MRAHGEAFAGVDPANTTYFVAGFIPEGVLVEVELDAIVERLDELRLGHEPAGREAVEPEDVERRDRACRATASAVMRATAGAIMNPCPLKPQATKSPSATGPRIGWWSGVTS